MFYTDGAAAVERHIFLSTRRWKGEEEKDKEKDRDKYKGGGRVRQSLIQRQRQYRWRGEEANQKERQREHHVEKMCKLTI